MKNVILIHGAWHWAGCWNRMKQYLNEKQCNVFTPELEVKKSTVLTDHVNQVVNIINQHNLNDIILVGHSYAGLVISGVLSEVPNRIKHTVFLDAILPEKGVVPFDYYMPKFVVFLFKTYARLFPLLKPLSKAEGFGIKDEETIRFVNRNLRKHPIKTMLQSFNYDPPYNKDKCSFISCSQIVTVGKKKPGKQKNHLEQFFLKAKQLGWTTYTLDSGHDVMLILPKEVSEIVLSV